MSVTNEQLSEACSTLAVLLKTGTAMARTGTMDAHTESALNHAAKEYLDLLNQADASLMTKDRIIAKERLNRFLTENQFEADKDVSKVDWNEAA